MKFTQQFCRFASQPTVTLCLFVVFLMMGCRSAQIDDINTGVIHPKVFSMIECWWSDTQQPVVTEISLDAVAGNDNQFDHDAVRMQGDWVHYTDPKTQNGPREGFMRYRVVESDGDLQTVLFQSNGGGTLTTESVITYRITKRYVGSQDSLKEITVLRVEAMR